MVKSRGKRLVYFALFVVSVLYLLTAWPASSSFSVRTPSLSIGSALPSSLRALAERRNFSIGSTVDYDALESEPMYGQTLASQFNMVTAEVAMKFDHTEPQPGVYTFAEGDTIVAFAKAHGMTIRGHNLVWYSALPAWVANGTFTRDQLIAILRDHIMKEVAHYRGEVNIWDVVNEAIDDNGNLRDSIWLRVIGPDYIDMAFRWAHEANPQALLFYNDYGGEGMNHKSDAIYALVKGLVERGVPINGVGLQMHVALNRYPGSQDVLANMRRLAALGLQVQITEMDVEIQGDARPLEQRLAAQASIYGQMLSVCLSFAPCTAFVMWGFTDAHSWIPAFTGHADEPLIFDAEYRPKPAYYALQAALRDPPLIMNFYRPK